ncbi:MAG TPA: cytochrome c oxidase subunit I, partial [Deltaproteobacteria bacterium]|nr:cytochrome c oxidase subunit I [Deltaproteobacteria bacterium]
LGMAGQHRRIYNYRHFPDLASPDLQGLRVFATISLVIMLLFQIPFLINFFGSMFRGRKAEPNPWKANTLEWIVPSPPPHGNFKELPSVYRGPYEYSVPGNREDYWPQHMPGRN